jgi:hypothetical protein
VVGGGLGTGGAARITGRSMRWHLTCNRDRAMRTRWLAVLVCALVAGCDDCQPDVGIGVDASVAVDAAPPPFTTGVLPSTLRVAVVPYNFVDHEVESFTTAQLRDLVFDGAGSDWATASVRSYFDEITEGRMTITGHVYDWVTLPFSQYHPGETRLRVVDTVLLPDIHALVGVQGFSPGDYDVVVYTYPYDIAGTYKGGPVTFAPAVDRHQSLHTYIHELGHFLGLSHANTYTCGRSGHHVSIGPSSVCSTTEYNDHTSVMGGGLVIYHPSAYEKLAIGVWGAGQVEDVTASGTFTLPALERAGVPGTRALRIPINHSHDGDRPAFYYLSYRQPIGFDAPRAGGPWVRGLSIHLAIDYRTSFPTGGEAGAYRRFGKTQLIDSNPDTGGSFADGALPVGQTFRDPIDGVAIRLVSIDGEAATVAIDLGCRTSRVITSSRPAVGGTSAVQALDRDENTGLVTGFDDWQYVEIDTGPGCEIDVGAIRRKMSPGSPIPHPDRGSQGEGVMYSLDGSTYSWLLHDQTSGWGAYVPYDDHAWHTVGYGWSSWLELGQPVRARHLRFQWDGNGPAESLDELELY